MNQRTQQQQKSLSSNKSSSFTPIKHQNLNNIDPIDTNTNKLPSNTSKSIIINNSSLTPNKNSNNQTSNTPNKSNKQPQLGNNINIGKQNVTPNKPQIQILSKTKPLVSNNIQFQSPKSSSLSVSPPKFTTPSKSPTNQNKTKPGFRPTTNKLNIQSPSVPSSTTEQSPAPSLVPIPFGLATEPIKLDSYEQNKRTPIINSRNALLNSLFSSPKQVESNSKLNQSNPSQPPPPSQNHPFSILMGLNQDQSLLNKQDSQFQKLNRISKLREILKSDQFVQSFVNNEIKNKEFDIVEHFKSLCKSNDIKLNYSQYALPDGQGYQGEIYLEGFMLIKEQDKKRKRCSHFAHRKAIYLLNGQSEMAVRIAQHKRDLTLKLDEEETSNGEIEFEFELHLVDSDNGSMNVNSCSAPNPLQLQTPKAFSMSNFSIDSSDLASVSLPQIDLLHFNNESNFFNNNQDISSLNSMLKSLILPNNNTYNNQASFENLTKNENLVEDDMQDDDENDRSEGIDKKTR